MDEKTWPNKKLLPGKMLTKLLSTGGKMMALNSCNFISGWATEFTTKMVEKQQGVKLSRELKTAAFPDEVPGKMKELMAWYKAIPDKTFDDLLEFHFRFERIHRSRMETVVLGD